MVPHRSAKTFQTGNSLRSLISAGGIVVAPGAFDAFSAKLVERAGFPAVYITGFGLAAASAALPDLGLLDRSEIVAQIASIDRAVSIPLIVDADTGFGHVLHLERTVMLLEQAGASAIQVEDQAASRRCGHLEGKTVVSPAEMVRKIRALKGAQTNPDTVLIARTDSRSVNGLDDALKRGEVYFGAGADVLFVEAPRSEEELRRIAEEFRGQPLLANMPEGGMSPYLSFRELEAMGFRIVIYPVTTLFSAAKAMMDALGVLKNAGRLTDPNSHVTFSEFTDILGVQTYLEKLSLEEEDD